MEKFLFDIYNARASHAEEIWSLKRLLHAESEFLRLSPSEKEETSSDELAHIQSCRLGNKLVLVAEHEKRIIGYLSALVQTNEHKINKVTLGVLQKYQGNGIGSQLIKEMENWAVNVKISEIEMNVMTHNLPALGLYQKLGYRVIGTTPTYQLYDSEKRVYDYILKKTLQ